jgi:Nitrile hydratase beta subunit
MRRPNDLGGLPAGPVDPTPHDPEPWQRLITALVTSVGPSARRITVVDEFRRAREDLDKEFYDSLSYFELWAEGFVNLLEEKGVLTRKEVEARMTEMKARQ